MKNNFNSDISFETLFRKYFRPLVFYALQYVKERVVAEDIVQDVFVSVYERKEVITIQSSDKSYLYRAVRNRCVDHLRSYKIKEDHTDNIKEAFNSMPSDPLEQVAIIEFESDYVQALDSLSPKCREVFKLSRMEGKKNSEIAHELKLSKRTVEKHISLALKVLREKLKNYMNEYSLLRVK